MARAGAGRAWAWGKADRQQISACSYEQVEEPRRTPRSVVSGTSNRNLVQALVGRRLVSRVAACSPNHTLASQLPPSPVLQSQVPHLRQRWTRSLGPCASTTSLLASA